jgi:hypothetical protein
LLLDNCRVVGHVLSDSGMLNLGYATYIYDRARGGDILEIVDKARGTRTGKIAILGFLWLL